MQKYFFIINYFLIIVFGVFYYSKIKDSIPLKLFMVFLIYSFFTEVAGTYFAFYIKTNTAVIYNSWNVVNYLFLTYFFASQLESNLKRNIVLGFGISYLALFILNSFFLKNYLAQVFVYNIVIGKILIVIWVLMYFSELLKGDRFFKVVKSMYFWITTGVFIYAVGFIPVFLVAEYISFGSIFRKITFGLNIVMSVCFITGFIMSEKEYNL